MLRLIRQTDWGALLGLVSPKFFEVLAPGALRGEVSALMSSYRDRTTYERLVNDRSSELHEMGIDLVEEVSKGDEADPRTYGQKLIELYFWQLFARDTCLLDLRSTRVRGQGDRLRWKPAKVYTTWDPSFIHGLRALYGSFYDGDTDGFHAALDELDLSDAASVFIEHFGGDEQRAVRFELDAFQQVFHRVFTIAIDNGKRLHPNFVSFGVYLGALYENLSRFDHAYDVRKAVASARARLNCDGVN